ncbi:MAG: maleylacetoacetate isomerase [Gammaproteobacteria bacterium]|jgi:maleylacetoacetate isomerase
MIRLFSTPGDSSADSIRIALALKGLSYDIHPFEELENATDVVSSPALEEMAPSILLDEKRMLTQALPIIEYLDESWHEPTLLPGMARERAQIRSLAYLIMSETNTRVAQRTLQALPSGVDTQAWQQHWYESGLAVLESLMMNNPTVGRFCYGDQVTLADVCLIPVSWAARRAGLDLSAFPTIQRICGHCIQLPEIAHIAAQAD